MRTWTASSPDGCPGPSGAALARAWATMLRDPLAGYETLRRDYGDTVRVPLTPHRSFYVLARPEQAEHVLVAHQDRYVKAFTYRPLQAFLGQGLLTSEGETWRRHRGLVQPVFSRRRVRAFAPQMVEAAHRRAQAWPAGEAIDLAAEMRTLTMDVIGRVLLGTDLAAEAERVGAALSRLQDTIMLASVLSGVVSPRRARTLVTRLLPGLGAAASTLEGLVATVIDRRLAESHGTALDLLDLLIGAGGDEQPLDWQEIHDEVMTLVLAGHETTANTLAWTLILLSRFPAARERLHDEVDEVLAGRDADADDADALPWTMAVISEAMRLYPPAWTIERDAVVDDTVAGLEIPAGSSVAISPYLLHRHQDFWPNPEGFDPARFLPGRDQGRPRYA